MMWEPEDYAIIPTPEEMIAEIKRLRQELADAQAEIARLKTLNFTNDGNWIPWFGGECPVEKYARVGVKFRNEVEWPEIAACLVRWGHSYSGDDIVAYRVVA